MQNTAATSGLKLKVPTAEGITDAIKALEESVKKGKYILITPNGLMFENENPLFILAALGKSMRGEAFDLSHLQPKP